MTRASLVLLLTTLLLSVSAQEGRLAYVNPQGQIVTVAADGSDVRTLGGDGMTFQFPAWAPDNSALAAIGSDGEGGGVYRLEDAEGMEASEFYRSSRDTPFYLYWAPDSRRLGFLINYRNGYALQIAYGEGESRLHATGTPFFWQWSADSERMLIHTGGFGRDARLSFMDALEDDQQANLALPGFFRSPGLSYNERYLAYSSRNAAGTGRLVLESTDPDDNIRRELPHNGFVALSWSPTGDLLAFTASPVPAPHSYGALRVLNAETGDLETLVADVVLAFFWAPDGQSIAYFTPVMTPGGGTLTRTPGELYAQAPSASIMRLDLSVVTLDGLTRRLHSFEATPLFLQQFLPFFDQYALSHRIWSADSRAIAIPVLTEAGGSEVIVVGLEGDITVIGEGESPFWTY